MDKLGNALIVEDNQISANILARKISNLFEKVDIIDSGEEAINLLKKNEYQLVLLDLNMPGISGIGVLKYIRKIFDPFQLPVLIISSDEKKQTIVDALKEGANDYLLKNFDWQIQLVRIKTQLNLTNLFKISKKLQEIQAVNALVTTYNHEINNPLCVAMARLNIIKTKEEIKDLKSFNTVIKSLERIESVVDKIKNATEDSIEYEEYVGSRKMIKI